MTYYLFRHGETKFSRENVPYGDGQYTAEILETGKMAVKAIANYLLSEQIEVLLSSKLLRCQQTSKIISEITGIIPKENELFNEFTEENFEEFKVRLINSAEYLKGLNYSKIAVCTHGANIAGLKKVLLGEAFHSHDLMYYPKTGVIVKVQENLQELDFNR